MKIEILGAGCAKCEKLAANAEAAVKSLGRDDEVCKVTELKEIMNRGVMVTPALAVDGEVKSSGKVLSEKEIEVILQEASSS
jgi:small redox-active disulfide protein 2